MEQINSKNSEENIKNENSKISGNKAYYTYINEMKQSRENDEDYCTSFMTF
ncbi:hypothetical protein [Clostridium fermenticellae]|uniref:hypothetical protein n=1 Tax=Clostridium fermenticellae TaxID=2068654 RepID=UPI0013C4B1DA|nr:hypothetical protein [Clostridium fermenticellae]